MQLDALFGNLTLTNGRGQTHWMTVDVSQKTKTTVFKAMTNAHKAFYSFIFFSGLPFRSMISMIWQMCFANSSLALGAHLSK